PSHPALAPGGQGPRHGGIAPGHQPGISLYRGGGGDAWPHPPPQRPGPGPGHCRRDPGGGGRRPPAGARLRPPVRGGEAAGAAGPGAGPDLGGAGWPASPPAARRAHGVLRPRPPAVDPRPGAPPRGPGFCGGDGAPRPQHGGPLRHPHVAAQLRAGVGVRPPGGGADPRQHPRGVRRQGRDRGQPPHRRPPGDHLMFRWLTLLWLLALPVAGAEPIPVVDADGKTLTLAAPARRIVSLSPHITEQLFAIGAGERVVGTVEWSDYPAAAERIPRLGTSSAINHEVLLRLDPDLVIRWRSGNGEGLAARLRALGLPVYVQEPRSLDDIPAELGRLGTLTGRERQAAAVVADFNDRIARLRAAYSGRRPVRVFQQIWNQPMISLNGEHLVSDIIRLCGGENIFADAPALVVNTSLEAVVLKDPEVI